MALARTAFSGLLLLVAALALALTVYVLGGAFGYYSVVVGSRLTVGDLSSLAVAGGTLFLGTATALLTLSTRDAAAETRDEARSEREAARAVLEVTFDQSQPVLWSSDIGYVRVMVVNRGQAMAHHVVVMLEKIEPRNPMLDAEYVDPHGPVRHGDYVLPSRLQWKGHDYRRLYDLVCDINPQAHEYFDVLDCEWHDDSARAFFWIDEWRDAFGLGFEFDGKQPP
jgi:hypothetical protein